MEWSGKNILIFGAARQGLSLTRFLVKHGANVTLTDNRPADQLQDTIQSLEGLSVNFAFGGHPLELLDKTDLISVSGGVPLTLPILEEAKRREIPLTNDSQIFMEAVPCKVIGITGSAGKTTTTTLVGEIIKNAIKIPARAWVGGNIGLPLIDLVDQIKEDDKVILELSSFQLELMTKSPHIALITNITPNHLDRHGTLEAYTEAKAHILDYQSRRDITILNRDDPGAWALRKKARGDLFSFGFSKVEDIDNGAFLINDELVLQFLGMPKTICHRSEVPLRGDHNIMNVLAACTIALTSAVPVEIMRETILNFKGVDHRMEFVREWKGAKWINDSIATAPERTIAAIESYDEPLLLLLGGKDKNLPWNKLAQLVHQKVDHVVIFGHAAEKIETALQKESGYERPFSITRCEKMDDALQAAGQIVQPGQVVLLSPGGTSYDEFTDFAERGERFRAWLHNQQ